MKIRKDLNVNVSFFFKIEVHVFIIINLYIF